MSELPAHFHVWTLRRFDVCGALRRSFTLAELLVVMGIIGVIAGVTLVSYRGIAKDAKLSSAKNTVMTVLDNARALAMKDNQIVMVVFRARPNGEKDQYVEAMLVEWTRESYLVPGIGLLDRFRPIPNTASRALPSGIQIAAPQFGGDVDHIWQTCSHFPGIAMGERAAAMLAVMYAPDGTVITRNTQGDSHRMFVDFNDDRLQRQDEEYCDNTPSIAVQGSTTNFPDNTNYCDLGDSSTGSTLAQFFCHHRPDDEPYVSVAPFLAVYDDAQARELSNTAQWNDGQQRNLDLTAYITANADRIHFNRYTGVAMK